MARFRLNVAPGSTIVPLIIWAARLMFFPESGANPRVVNSPTTPVMPSLFSSSVVSSAGWSA